MTAIADARILIIATNRFEESELFDPRETLLAKGATVTLAAIESGTMKARLVESNARRVAAIESGEQVVVEFEDSAVLVASICDPSVGYSLVGSRRCREHRESVQRAVA